MADRTQLDHSILRLGAVSFLNALPLTDGLDVDPRVSVTRDVPARLADLLDNDRVDVALIPVVDTIRFDRHWPIVSDACIGCDGATLTVRVFSRVDPADIETLHVDTDSHSSVALAAVLWKRKYNRDLRLVPFRVASATADQIADCQAMLLIGDKVIRPPGGLEIFSTQIDLGAAWKSLTGLPFVFAAWAARDSSIPPYAAEILSAARDAGVACAAILAEQHASKMGWPIDLARRYLTQNLNFTITPRHREGMELFLDLVRRYDVFATTDQCAGVA